MGMNGRLLRPRTTSTTHPEATAWRTAVLANGGTVSSTTLSAVSTFCRSIDATAGLRACFYRLNLFCGTGLSACLVPLYRGPASGGTQYGNTTETNNNFVSGDYNETGSSSGLTGNGTSKWLNTGVPANFLSASNIHMGVGLLAVGATTGARDIIGAWNNGSNTLMIRLTPQFSGTSRAGVFTRFGTSTDQCGPATTVATGNIVATYPTYYNNGVATGTDATTSQDYPSAHSLAVFALLGSNTTTYDYCSSRLGWYSIGSTMSSAQVVAFHNALTTFAGLLSRT
jgi:hypothetical protein